MSMSYKRLLVINVFFGIPRRGTAIRKVSMLKLLKTSLQSTKGNDSGIDADSQDVSLDPDAVIEDFSHRYPWKY